MFTVLSRLPIYSYAEKIRKENIMGTVRSDEIELLAKNFLENFLNLQHGQIHDVEEKANFYRPLLETKGLIKNVTPDFILTENFEQVSLSDLFFLEVNEPTGGIFVQHGISNQINESFRTAPRSNGFDGNYNRVLLHPPNSEISNEIINKLKKSYKKYALNRDQNKTNSVNTGLVFCMGDEPSEEIRNEAKVNLSNLQFQVLIPKLIRELSGSEFTIKNAFEKRNEIFEFNFTEQYKYMGFVMAIGNHSATGYNFYFVNKFFLDNSNSIVAQKIKNKIRNKRRNRRKKSA